MIRAGTVALLALLLMSSASPRALAQVECPVSTLYCLSERTTTAVRDSMSCFDPYEQRVSEILVDHRQGLASAIGRGGDVGGRPRLTAADNFRVTGLPFGTPVTLKAHFRGQLSLHLSGPSYYPFGWVKAALTESASNTASEDMVLYCDPFYGCPFDETRRELDLSITVATVSDQVFRLEYAVECDLIFGRGMAEGRLSFSGLPSGVVVTSCKGFQQDAPTPTVPTSWGGLKIRYR